MDNLAYDYGLLTNLLITICMVFEHRDINLFISRWFEYCLHG